MDWRKTREYRIWRATVIMRDKRCVICNSLRSRHAHHLNHATYFKEERFDPENGVCLCSKCHTQYHNNFHRSTRVKCTKYDFDNFVHLAEYMFGKKEEFVAGLMIPMLFRVDGEMTTLEEVMHAVGIMVNEFFEDGSAITKLRRLP